MPSGLITSIPETGLTVLIKPLRGGTAGTSYSYCIMKVDNMGTGKI